MALSPIQSAFSAFLEAARPWAATRADAPAGQALLSLQVVLGTAFTTSGRHYAAPHGANGHQSLAYAARRRAVSQAWQQVHESLCAQAPILRGNSHHIREDLGAHATNTVWSLRIADRTTATDPNPEIIAQSLDTLAQVLKGRPMGTRRFSITGTDAASLTLHAESPEDALALFYALVPLPVLPTSLAEIHPLRAIRGRCQDWRTPPP